MNKRDDVPAESAADAGLVLLGRIGAAQGLRGEVRIATFTEAPESIAAYGPLIDRKGRSFVIEALRTIKGGTVAARLAGVASREAAEALNGTELYIAKDRLPDPDENEWYYEDLIGLKAVDGEGAEIGQIAAVQNYGAGDLLEIRLTDGGRTTFVPFTQSAVPAVDIKAGRVTVIMPEEIEDEPSE